MIKIILNDEEFGFGSYSRNVYFSEEGSSSTAYINDIRGTNVANRLETLAEGPITSINIEKDDEVIYSLDDIQAKITSMDEQWNGENIVTNINMQFN